MTIPKAVSPATLTPGTYMTVDMLASVASAGSGTLRVAIVSPKSTDGDLTVNTEVRAGAGIDSASVAFGPGAPGYRVAKQIYDIDPRAQLDFVGVTPGSTAATLDLTFANSPTSDSVLECDILGKEFEVTWPAAATADEFKEVLIDAINAYKDETGVIASSGGTGIVTLTYCLTGAHGNDVKVYFKIREQKGTETINTGTSVSSALAGGTTDPDYSTAISNLVAKEYHFILLCASNTDVANVSTANGISDVVSYIDSNNSGLNAKLQTVIAGYTGSAALAIASAPNSNSFNNAVFGQLIHCLNGRSLPCEYAAREVAGWLKVLPIDAAANRIGERYTGVAGAKDKVTNKLDPAEIEALLLAGVTPLDYDAQGNLVLVRPMTTHSQTATGAQDRRLLDMQNTHAEYIVSRDLRDNIGPAFPNAKISQDLEPGEEPLPDGVVEVSDVRGWVYERVSQWIKPGVVNRTYLKAAYDDGSLIVEIDDTDTTQVNIVVPKKIVQPLAKFSLVSQHIAG